MAYLNCPFCPAQALQSLRVPSKFPACGVVIFKCISGHKFYVEGEDINEYTREPIDSGSTDRAGTCA
jgi:hypothetical protein